MDRLNYNHLRCFWAVAREGSIAGACERLGVTQPTISKQIGDLEDALDEDLFRRTGRRLVLTDVGRRVYAYADDIFSLGQELLDVVRSGATGKPLRLHVGVSDVVPKLLTRMVLEPALRTDQPVRLVCREGKTESLLADLALAGFDALITDAPLAPGMRVRAFNHRLGESPVALYGPQKLVSRCRRGFPGSIDGQPVLLPTENTALRSSIDAWLERNGLRPRIVAEIEDSALLKTFGAAGHGLFFAPVATEREIAEQLSVGVAGPAEGVSLGLYLITVERRIVHPGIEAVLHAAREILDQS